jgi:hypothetical protein
VTSICRDRDGDGLCDLSTACSDPATLDARIRTGVVRGSLPGAARYRVSARLGLAGNVARAEPRQSGLTLRTVAADGVLIDLVVPGGNDWQRMPTGGWSYRAPAGSLLRAKVRIEKDEAFVRVVTPGTLYATTEARTIVALGALCGSEGERCLVKGTPRRRPRLFRLSCS